MSAAKNDSLQRLVRILIDHGPLRAGELGLELWWKPGNAIRTENNALTMHCRAAGKMLRRAERLGLVRCDDRGTYQVWYANAGNDASAERR